jgi:hypothetical protein
MIFMCNLHRLKISSNFFNCFYQHLNSYFTAILLFHINYNFPLGESLLYTGIEAAGIKAQVRKIRSFNTFHASFSRNKCFAAGYNI